MKQAETCGLLFDAAIEPDGRVERDHLVDQQVGQLGLERLGIHRRGEVVRLPRPQRYRGLHHAVDQLSHAVLTLRSVPSGPAEVFLGHDIGGQLPTSASGPRRFAARTRLRRVRS